MYCGKDSEIMWSKHSCQSMDGRQILLDVWCEWRCDDWLISSSTYCSRMEIYPLLKCTKYLL